MALNKPTLEQVRNDLQSGITGRLCDGNYNIPNSIIRILSHVIGFAIWALYEWIEREGRTLSDANGSLLDSYGQMCGIERASATRAYGYAIVYGNGTVPAGATLTRCDGVSYETLESVTSVSGSAIVPIMSKLTGFNQNSPASSDLSFSGSYAGIQNKAKVSENGVVGGADNESEESFRQRIIACFKSPCRSGTQADYEFWAKQHPGVTRVWSYATALGNVKVVFTMDNTYPNGIPTLGDVNAVQSIIDDNKPLGVKVEVCAPKVQEIDISIKTNVPMSVTDRNAVTQNLTNLFANTRPGTLCYGNISHAIYQVYPECFTIITPNQNVEIGLNSVPVLGDVNFYVGA